MPYIIHKYIFDNLWIFTGISVKYKTQIGTNDHKLSKILFTQTNRLIMNYALWIMNYYRPQISTDFKDFSQARKHIKVQDF